MRRTSLLIVASAAAALAATPAMAQNAGAGANGGANGAAANGNGGAGANGRAGARGGASVGGALITISPSGVRQVQQVLNRLGYFAGPVNGVWDRESADAMAHFQEAHGLEPTGNVNFGSIAGLGLWDNIIGDPLGNGHKSLEAKNASMNGAPPPRGNGKTVVGGEPLPSQRLTTTGGNTLGSNTTLPGQPTGNRVEGRAAAGAGAGAGGNGGGANGGAGVGARTNTK